MENTQLTKWRGLYVKAIQQVNPSKLVHNDPYKDEDLHSEPSRIPRVASAGPGTVLSNHSTGDKSQTSFHHY